MVSITKITENRYFSSLKGSFQMNLYPLREWSSPIFFAFAPMIHIYEKCIMADFFFFSTTRGVVRGGQSFDKMKNVLIFKWAQRIQFSRYLNNFNCTWKIFYRRIDTIFLLLSLWRIFGVENASKSTKSVIFQRMYASIFLKIGPSIPVYVTNIVLKWHVWYISSLGDTAF